MYHDCNLFQLLVMLVSQTEPIEPSISACVCHDVVDEYGLDKGFIHVKHIILCRILSLKSTTPPLQELFSLLFVEARYYLSVSLFF